MFFILLSVFVVSQIVVVDDDILLCSLLIEVLSDEGYDVESFHSGEDALNYMQGHSVDLVLLDVMLSKLNGMQVARFISKSELQKEVLKKDLCPFDRNLDMHISNIRRKMVKLGLSKQHIKTVRGKGYSFIERV